MAKANETVITVDGTTEIRSNCRRIKGGYYRVGDPKVQGSGQCYLVNGKYCREETNYIVYNYEAGEYVLSSDTLTKGVVSIDGEILKIAYFTTPKQPIKLYDISNTEYILINEEAVGNSRVYRYHIEKDAYLHISLASASSFNKIARISAGYKNTLEYDTRAIMHRYVKAYDDNDIKIDSKIEKVAPYLKDLTFGIEFETVAGQIPDRYTKPLGLIPLKDGSVPGLEYATVPYQGAKGLQAAVNSCNVLNKFTRDDETCALHLHIGNVPRTEEFFLALFKTLCLVQDEVFEMFPLYKKYNFGVKKKNYTQPFPVAKLLGKMDGKITKDKVKENFAILFNFLSAGQQYEDVGNSLSKVKSHPSDPEGTRKWNIKSRYYWVNLIPLLFGNKQTVEFRIHTPTTDPSKVINYLLICTSIVSYVKNNTDNILEGNAPYDNLSNIIMTELRNAPYNLIDHLLFYMNYRKKSILKSNHVGDFKGNEALIKSPKLSFLNNTVKEENSVKVNNGYIDAPRAVAGRPIGW